MTRALLAVLAAYAASGCTTECTIEAHVTEFLEEHGAIDCRFAHQRFIYNENELIGATTVRDCFRDALETHQAFIGGYVFGGIDSGSTTAFLGDANGRVRMVVESWDAIGPSQRLSRTNCDRFAATTDALVAIGYECIGADLEPVCSE